MKALSTMQICFFEDEQLKQFFPLALTRPLDDLRTGILTIREKWLHRLDTQQFARLSREPVSRYFKHNNLKPDHDVWWINSRLIPDNGICSEIKTLEKNTGISIDGEPFVFRVDFEQHVKLLKNSHTNPENVRWTQSTGTVLKFVWDLFELNGSQISHDTEVLSKANLIAPYSDETTTTIGEMQLFAGKNVTVDPGVIIDARKGPVILMDNCHIMSGSVLQGPLSIGEKSVVKVGSKIYPETTIGPVCKVAGEIQNCIFYGYSNKAHDGFVGNSIFGEWCNLGADTNTSNLKNNYSDIILKDWEEETDLDSGIQFCGTIMGDHSKTAINTMLNTGTQVGVASNIFSSGFPPKFIPSFSWVGTDVTEHIFDKAMDTAQRMMDRRGIKPTEDYISMMKYIFDHK